MSRTIYVEAEVDMSDIDEDDLIEELERRNKKKKKKLKINETCLDYYDLIEAELNLTRQETLSFIKKLLGLKSYDDTNRIIKEIIDL